MDEPLLYWRKNAWAFLAELTDREAFNTLTGINDLVKAKGPNPYRYPWAKPHNSMPCREDQVPQWGIEPTNPVSLAKDITGEPYEAAKRALTQKTRRETHFMIEVIILPHFTDYMDWRKTTPVNKQRDMPNVHDHPVNTIQHTTYLKRMVQSTLAWVCWQAGIYPDPWPTVLPSWYKPHLKRAAAHAGHKIVLDTKQIYADVDIDERKEALQDLVHLIEKGVEVTNRMSPTTHRILTLWPRDDG